MAQTQHRKIRRQARLAWLDDYKTHQVCADCNTKYPAVCLDFHHINPKDKVSEVRRMIKDDFSMKRIKAEIDKCVVLCANCHRLRHAQPVEEAAH